MAMTEVIKTEQELLHQLSGKMVGVFESTLDARKQYYSEHPDKRPDPQSVDSIISKCARSNMVISGGVGLIPGPFGMAAAIPEIIVIVRNQVAMICDIGVAYSREEKLDKGLLVGVFASAMGVGGITLLTMHGGKVLVRRASLRVFQKMIAMLAGRVTQQLLKSMMCKWLPVVGAAAMAAWSNYSTRQLGKGAVEIFQKEIVYTSEEAADVQDIEGEPSPAAAGVDYEVLRIEALINLMQMDKKIAPEEREYVEMLVERANISAGTKDDLLRSVDSSEEFSIDFSLFASVPNEGISLLVDLVALAQRDGIFHVSERMYIKQVGSLLGFSDGDIEEMMVSV